MKSHRLTTYLREEVGTYLREVVGPYLRGEVALTCGKNIININILINYGFLQNLC